MTRPDPDRSVGFLVSDVARLLRRDFTRRAEALGLTQTQCKTLARLSHNEGINQTALADLLEIQPITLTRLIDKLQEAGLVERRPDPVDRRAFRLHLTDAAEPVLEQIWGIVEETQAAATIGVAPEIREHVIAALGTMRQNLMQAESPAAEKQKQEQDA